MEKENFWVESNPGEQFPDWHAEPCCLQVVWDWGRQKPKKNNGGVNGYAMSCQVVQGGDHVQPGKIFRMHVCAHTPCTAHWTDSKYGLLGQPLHVRLAGPPAVAGDATVGEPAHAAPAVDGDATLAGASHAASFAEAHVGGEHRASSASPEPTTQPAVADGGETPENVEDLFACGGADEPAFAAPATVAPPCAPAPMEQPLLLPSELQRPPLPSQPPPSLAPLRRYPPAAVAAAPAPVLPAAKLLGEPHIAAAGLLNALTAFARRLRQPRTTVGYSAFLLFALCKRRRPLIWEGETVVDLIQVYAPWVAHFGLRPCACDGVACAMEARSSGHAEMYPISDHHPLSSTRHWIAATRIHMDLGVGSNPMQEFYNRLGLVLLGTLTNNDCGLDVMCMMMQEPQTAGARDALRIELSDYLLDRLRKPWMMDMMAAMCEVDAADVALARKCGLLRAAGSEPIDVEEPAVDEPAVAGSDPIAADPRAEMRKAMFPDGEFSDTDTDAETPAVVGPHLAGDANGKAAIAGSVMPTALVVAPVPSYEIATKAIACATGTTDQGEVLALLDTLPE